MNVEYRRVTLEDAKEYQQLIHQAYKPVTELGINFAAASATLTDIETHIRTNLVFATYIDEKLVCTLSLRLPWGNNPGPYGVPHIGWVATDPSFKQQGLAAELLDWVEKYILIGQFKLPFVSLGTAANHPWLSNFYIKQGFIENERVDLSSDHTTIYFYKVLNQETFKLWQQRNPNRIF